MTRMLWFDRVRRSRSGVTWTTMPGELVEPFVARVLPDHGLRHWINE